MEIRYEGTTPVAGSGFERWLRKRASKAPKTADEDYKAYVAAMRGAEAERMAGVPTTGSPGGPDPAEGLSEEQVYRQYLDVLSGEASRREAQETVKREKLERDEEILRHLRQAGGGTSRDHDHLRDRLKDSGFGSAG